MKIMSFYKQPKWNIMINSFPFSWIPFFEKSYSLVEPLWKDKYNTPRVEIVPHISFKWLGIDIYIHKGTSEYWERYLWIHDYNEGDEIRAIELYPWNTGKREYTRLLTWFNWNE